MAHAWHRHRGAGGILGVQCWGLCPARRSAPRGWQRGGRVVEVGTALLCIFNDRPMPGARESGKILFVTCWQCTEAPAPRLISGKMRMLAGWPVGVARRGLLGVRAGGCRVGRTWGGGVFPPAWPWPNLGALSPGHRAPPLPSGPGSACGCPGTNSPCPHQPSLPMHSPFFPLAQLHEQPLAVPAPQVGIAHAAPRGTWDICTGKSRLVQVL